MGFEELRDMLDGYVIYKPENLSATKEQLLGLARKHSVR
jgi:hypothetical protein